MFARVLSSLTVLALVLAGPLQAQQAHAAQGFRLSKAADFSSEDRVFAPTDTLHVEVTLAPLPLFWTSIPVCSLSGASGPIAIVLSPTAPYTFRGALELDALAEGEWTWQASAASLLGTRFAPEDTLTIASVPTADFTGTPLSGVAPLSVSFTDLSSGTITSHSWSFGDGETSTLASPSHVYASAGTYTVALTATGPGGSATETQEGLVGVSAPPEPEVAIRYGMNASENAWYQRGIAFADAMARASEFCTVVDGTITRDLVPRIAPGQDPPLVGEGWPDATFLNAGERIGTRLFGSMDGSLPDGRVVPYVLTWDGTGACNLEGPAVIGQQNRTAQRVEVFVDPTAGNGNALLLWVIDGPDPVDPVRNAHVWLPGMEATRPVLWPPFVEKLATMNAGRGPDTWRAMDWCRVNEYGKTTGSAPFVFDLAGRIRPSSPTQGSKRGVCPEFTVALCNALGVDLHFNVPHPANDISLADYDAFLVDTLQRLRDGSPAVAGIHGDQPFAGLAPGLTVTLELSNELWNPGFPAQAWMVASAMANGRTLHQEIAWWIDHVFELARGVFAGPDAVRLRTFVGGRINDAGFLGGILDALDGPVDAVGPAAYFKPTSTDVNAWLVGATTEACPNCPTPEAVVLAAVLAMPSLAPFLANHRALADGYANPDGSHPVLELYEGGASFVANFQPWWVAAAEAQRIPDLYHAYVDDFVPMLVAAGVDQVNWYCFLSDDDAHGNGAGPFGHWDRMDQTITLPVGEPYLDEGAPKAAAMCKGPPLAAE